MTECRKILQVEVHVVGHVEIEIAVVVVVTESRAGAPVSRISHSSFLGDIGERSVVIIVVEHGAIEIGDVEVFPAIVVVVADGHSEAPSAMPDARLGADVGESAVVIVVVKLAGMALAGAHVFQRGAVYQENVHPAVVVIVEDSHAAAHGFHDVALFSASTGEMEIDARGASDIREGYGVAGAAAF